MAYPVGGNGGIMSDLLTDDREGIRRIAVDSQQSSFEGNAQFRYFDEFDGISNANQIVYKIATTYAVIVQEGVLSLWSGGRKYRVYVFDNGETFTGTLSDSGSITALNRILHETFDTHPETGVTIQRAVGSGIFTPGTNTPYTGQSVLTDGNNNRASSTYAPEGLRSGIAAGSIVWVVLDGIGSGNNDTYGEYELSWEERF